MVGRWFLAVGEWALENTILILLVGFLFLVAGLFCLMAVNKSLDEEVEELGNLVAKMKKERDFEKNFEKNFERNFERAERDLRGEKERKMEG